MSLYSVNAEGTNVEMMTVSIGGFSCRAISCSGQRRKLLPFPFCSNMIDSSGNCPDSFSGLTVIEVTFLLVCLYVSFYLFICLSVSSSPGSFEVKSSSSLTDLPPSLPIA